MDLLRNRRGSSRRSVSSHSEYDTNDEDGTYNDTEAELDVYASVPLFEDAPSPSFPVTFGQTDMARTLGIRGEICTAVFAPQVFAVVRKASVIFESPYSSIKSYSLRKDALCIEFGRVHLHGDGTLIMYTKYNKAMKECMHVNTDHVKRDKKADSESRDNT